MAKQKVKAQEEGVAAKKVVRKQLSLAECVTGFQKAVKASGDGKSEKAPSKKSGQKLTA